MQQQNQLQNQKQPLDQQCIKITFILFQLIVYAVAVYSIAFGNPQELGQPFDSEGHPCGVGIAMADYKYIYFTNPDPQYLWKTLCVKECPVLQPGQSEGDYTLSLQCHPNIVISQCDNRPDVKDPAYRTQYYNSVPYVNVCLPTKQKYLQNIQSGLEKNIIIRILSDLYNGKLLILLAMVGCLAINLFIQKLINNLPRFTVWLIALCSFLSLAGCGILGMEFVQLLKTNTTLPSTSDLTQEQVIGYVHTTYVNLQVLDIINYSLFGCSGFIFLIVLIKINKINRLGKMQAKIENLLAARYKEVFLSLFILTIATALIALMLTWLAFNVITTASFGASQKHLKPFDYFEIDYLELGLLFILGIDFFYLPLLIISISNMIVYGVVSNIFKKYTVNNDNSVDREEDINSIFGKVFQRFSTLIIGEVVMKIMEILFFYLYLINWIIGKRYCLFISQHSERAYLFSYLKQIGYSDSIQYYKEQEEQRQIFLYGDFYIKLTSITVASMCSALIYICLIYSQYHTLIYNPSFIIVLVWILSYLVTNLFSSINGKSLEAIEYLKVMQQIRVLDDQQQQEQESNLSQLLDLLNES